MENTKNVRDFDRLGAELQQKKARPLSGFRRNSLLNRTGNYFGGTRNFFDVTGNSIPRRGKPLTGIALNEGYPPAVETTNESRRIKY
jgi:hypothetical protein